MKKLVSLLGGLISGIVVITCICGIADAVRVNPTSAVMGDSANAAYTLVYRDSDGSFDAGPISATTASSRLFKVGEYSDMTDGQKINLATLYGSQGVVTAVMTSAKTVCIWSIEGAGNAVNSIHDSGQCAADNTSSKLGIIAAGAGVYYLHNGMGATDDVGILFFGF